MSPCRAGGHRGGISSVCRKNTRNGSRNINTTVPFVAKLSFPNIIWISISTENTTNMNTRQVFAFIFLLKLHLTFDTNSFFVCCVIGDRNRKSKWFFDSPQGDDKVCISDYCHILRCDFLRSGADIGYWEKALCKERKLEPVRKECEVRIRGKMRIKEIDSKMNYLSESLPHGSQ